MGSRGEASSPFSIAEDPKAEVKYKEPVAPWQLGQLTSSPFSIVKRYYPLPKVEDLGMAHPCQEGRVKKKFTLALDYRIRWDYIVIRGRALLKVLRDQW